MFRSIDREICVVKSATKMKLVNQIVKGTEVIVLSEIASLHKKIRPMTARF